MANTAISALPTVTTPLAGTEVLPVVQSSTTKRVTIAQIASYIGSYTLPTASASVLGGIKIGSGLSIDGSGVVSASGGGGASATVTISNKTAAYTVVAGDLGTIINCTSNTFTVALTAAATLGAGFAVTIWNTGGGAITIDPDSSETIDALATFILRKGEGTQIICDGTNWQTGNKKTMRGYAEHLPPSYTRSVASGDTSVAIHSGANAAGNDSVAIGLNSTTTSGGNSGIAIGRGASASNSYATAIGGFTSASGSNSTALGMNSANGGSQAVGTGAMALGGSYASGTDSFAAAIANNTSTYGAQGANSIAIGFQTKATNSGSVALGRYSISGGTDSFSVGSSSNASGSYSAAMGYQSAASGIGSFAFGATTHIYAATASANNSFAFGPGSAARLTGKMVISGGDLITSGIYQQGLQAGTQVLRNQTVNATATQLVSDTDLSTPGTTNQIILPNNSAYAFTGTIIARQQTATGNDFAAWEIKGGIVRGATAGTTALGTYNINVLSKSAGATAWTITLSADTTNGGLAITVTGAAATNIRWVATVQTSEVTYA